MEHISLKQWFCGSDAMEHIELILNIVCCLNYKRNYDDAKKTSATKIDVVWYFASLYTDFINNDGASSFF